MSQPKRPLDSLIVIFEALRQNTEAAAECLSAVSAVVQSLMLEPTLARAYAQARSADLAHEPRIHALQKTLAQLDATIQQLKQERG